MNDGSALVFLRATEAGTSSINISDGETSLGETTIEVAPAGSSPTPQLSATPAGALAGQVVTITASGLGGLETATFGLGGDSSGATVNPRSRASRSR